MMARVHIRKYPPGKRPRTGGRAKGTLNRSTILVNEMLTGIFHDLQAKEPGENGHMLAWAEKYPAEFYKIFCKSMPPPAAPRPHDPHWAVTWERASPEWRRQVLDGSIAYPDWMPPLGPK